MSHQPPILLVHGLHMSGLFMRPLARRLVQAGFITHTPSYHSLTRPIEAHSQRLHEYLTHHHDINKPLHMVGHSLGGLVIRHFLFNYPMWQVHRCVTLGTPHQGSICAQYGNRLLSMLVHHAYPNALDGTCVHPKDTQIEFGVIAGTRPFGIGLPILTYHTHRNCLTDDASIHDGTVYLSETHLAYAKDYLTLPVSHTGLLTDKTTASQTAYFLKHGQFDGHQQK